MKQLNFINISDRNAIQNLAFLATDYAFSNGICIKSPKDAKGSISTLPFTLIPSSFPRRLYDKVRKLQTDINLLYHKISYDHEFILSSLQRVVKTDDFMRKLFEIYLKVRREGKAQPLSLGLFRTDYLLDESKSGEIGIKQVETNAIASSFAAMASRVSNLHKYILHHIPQDLIVGELLKNDSLSMGQGLYDAWRAYNHEKAIIVFMAEDLHENYNILDQRGLEYEIFRLNNKIKVVYATFQNVHEKTSLDNKNNLFYDGQEVAVVYFRIGYHPRFFTCENDWNALFTIERSKAIKCPSVHYHLAGCKKIQQVLCKPNIMERFIDDSDVIEQIRTTFANIHSLEMNDENEEFIELAISQPNDYVLKPQREGGGNNLYGDELKQKLIDLRNDSARESYILMERILPPAVPSYVVKQGQVSEQVLLVSELGIYGYILGSSDQVIENSVAGHILRSKADAEDEGGIAVGCAFIDTPNLI